MCIRDSDDTEDRTGIKQLGRIEIHGLLSLGNQDAQADRRSFQADPQKAQSGLSENELRDCRGGIQNEDCLLYTSRRLSAWRSRD